MSYLPPALAEGKRAWGFAVNLYSLRSQRNWGIGDFSDLGTLMTYAASLGADFIGVNPLHTLHYVDATAASPYSPTSRYFLNPLYIDVEAAPEYEPHEASGPDEAESFERELRRLRAATHVDYAGVASAKRLAFARLFANFERKAKPKRHRAFERFVEAGGVRLERFACYEALTEHFASDDGRVRGWLTWPPEYHDSASPAVAAFAAEHADRIRFFTYLQFLADEQLAAALASGASMRIGLYRDLAVGVDRNSSDVWFEPQRYRLDVTVGAPPDPLAWQGQNWGLPPFDPSALEGPGSESFAALLRANMAHAGALRIDHVMSLLRLFLIPLGKQAAEGAYVAYPFEELLAVTRRESTAATCLVVGEDLGTVPDGFRDRMNAERILSYRLLLFERYDDGSFKRTDTYPQLSLATATTHDIPTLAGWALSRDVETRLSIGLSDPAAAAADRSQRRVDVSRLLDALRAEEALDDTDFARLHAAIDRGELDRDERLLLVTAAYRFLAKTPAVLLLVQLDDALGEIDQVNVPGTFFEYPNWRRKIGVELEALEADGRVAQVAAAVRDRINGRIEA